MPRVLFEKQLVAAGPLPAAVVLPAGRQPCFAYGSGSARQLPQPLLPYLGHQRQFHRQQPHGQHLVRPLRAWSRLRLSAAWRPVAEQGAWQGRTRSAAPPTNNTQLHQPSAVQRSALLRGTHIAGLRQPKPARSSQRPRTISFSFRVPSVALMILPSKDRISGQFSIQQVTNLCRTTLVCQHLGVLVLELANRRFPEFPCRLVVQSS